jgi:hypothetical protein
LVFLQRVFRGDSIFGFTWGSCECKKSDGQTAYNIAEKFAHFNLLEYLKSIGAKRGKEMKLKTSFAVNIPFKAAGKPA